MKKSILYTIFLLYSSYSLAENIEKLIPGKPIIQDWTEIETISCDDWQPTPNRYIIGTKFQQTTECLVRQERYTQPVWIGAITGEVKEMGEKVSEILTITKTKNREETGTSNPEYTLNVGIYQKEGKRYFGYLNESVQKAYNIKPENEGSLNNLDFKGFKIGALFQNENDFILLYDKEADDNIIPTLYVYDTVCKSTSHYLNNGDWDIFYFHDCIDLTATTSNIISLKLN